MPKVIDITDRLSNENTVTLKVLSTELEVKIDAETVLKALAKSDEKIGIAERYLGMQALLFTKESVKKLDKMNLPFPAYKTVIEIAFSIAIDSYDEESKGE